MLPCLGKLIVHFQEKALLFGAIPSPRYVQVKHCMYDWS